MSGMFAHHEDGADHTIDLDDELPDKSKSSQGPDQGQTKRPSSDPPSFDHNCGHWAAEIFRRIFFVSSSVLGVGLYLAFLI